MVMSDKGLYGLVLWHGDNLLVIIISVQGRCTANYTKLNIG
jgi:hypothetical protein